MAPTVQRDGEGATRRSRKRRDERGRLFIMAYSRGTKALRMSNGEDIWVDLRPQEFRTCPRCLVTRKRGQLDPVALGIFEQITFERMGGRA